jgi:hypothetical protein
MYCSRVCVCARARARVCVCVCVRTNACRRIAKLQRLSLLSSWSAVLFVLCRPQSAPLTLPPQPEAPSYHPRIHLAAGLVLPWLALSHPLLLTLVNGDPTMCVAEQRVSEAITARVSEQLVRDIGNGDVQRSCLSLAHVPVACACLRVQRRCQAELDASESAARVAAVRSLEWRPSRVCRFSGLRVVFARVHAGSLRVPWCCCAQTTAAMTISQLQSQLVRWTQHRDTVLMSPLGCFLPHVSLVCFGSS